VFEAPAPGILVVKDSPFPGWQATLNGQPAEIVRVNGLVRGVMVPAAGHYEIAMTYRPASFVSGVAISEATLVLLLALLTHAGVCAALRRRQSSSSPALRWPARSYRRWRSSSRSSNIR
jgi:hypothetical protein